MPKKKEDQSHLHTPDYESFKTVEEVETQIEKHKNLLVGKDRTESQIKKEKKEYVSALNEQLRELNEEREHEIDVISALEARRQVLHAAAHSNVVPMVIPKPAVG